jgi:putative FmdB family regulatory protein
MPIYTYRCESCGVQFERNQRFSDPPLSWCPECGKKSLRKVYTPVGIVFKGSGFYSTDNRSPSGSTSRSSASSEEKSADKTGDKGSEKAAESAPKDAAPAAKPVAGSEKKE